WVWETDQVASEFDFKVVLRQSSGEIHWESGENRKMQGGMITLIEPRF
ncbi:MAG: carbohydrate-binding module family 20 domain-containing protein, partial [Pseudobdellovibrionaceae bacterium]